MRPAKRGLALAALWCSAAEAQTRAPTFTTWRPTTRGPTPAPTTPAPTPRPTLSPAPTVAGSAPPTPRPTPAPTTLAPSTTAPTCVALECLLDKCRACLTCAAGDPCDCLAVASCKDSCTWAIKDDLKIWDGAGLQGAQTDQLDGFIAGGCSATDTFVGTASEWFRGAQGNLGLEMGAPSPRPTPDDTGLKAAQCLCCYDDGVDTNCFGQTACACCCGTYDKHVSTFDYEHDDGYAAKDCQRDCEKALGKTCVYAKEGSTDTDPPKEYLSEKTLKKITKGALDDGYCAEGAARARPALALLLLVILR